MKKHLIALQVYTVRDFAEQDFAGTMRKVKEMGYDGVELAGTYDMKAVEIKKILDEIGLELVSAHVNLNLIEDDAVLDDFAATGMKYIAIPWLTGPKNAEELKSTIERIQKAGERCKARGMQLLYHNHDFEFEKIDGRYILDAYYEELKDGLEREITEMRKIIAEKKKVCKASTDKPLNEILTMRDEINKLETKRKEMQRDLYAQQDALDADNERLQDKIREKLNGEIVTKHIMTISFEIV